MAQLPWGIISSSAGGLSVKGTSATLTSDSEYYYLTFTNSTNTAGTTTGIMLVEGGPISIDYLIVAGGGGSSGNVNVSSATTFWNCYYHSYYCDWWGDCWPTNYYCDDSKTVSIYRGAGGGAGGVITGSKSLNPGSYDISVGSGGSGNLNQAPWANPGVNTSAFGATATGGGAGVPTGLSGTPIRDGGSGGPGGTGISSTGNPNGTFYGNAGANGSFAGVGSTYYYTYNNLNKTCQELVSGGYSNSYAQYLCYESAGTGGGPLAPGVGHGMTAKATNFAAPQDHVYNDIPLELASGLTSLGLTVGFPGVSTDLARNSTTLLSPPANTGSGGSCNYSSVSTNGTSGVVRVRIAKSSMANVSVVS